MEKFEQPIIPETPEKSAEELVLKQSRGAYAGAYTEYCQAFGKMKEKDLAEFEKKVEPARKFIEAGDSEKFKIPLEELTEGGEKNKEFRSAVERKNNFIKELIERGIEEERARAIYRAELKKAEYEAAKVETGKKMAESGVSRAEIFQKLVLDEAELLNQQRVESWPPKEKGIFRKGMEWYMRRGTATRLLISTGLVTGVVAGAGGFGAAAAATFASYRFVRGFGSVMIGKLAGMGVDKIMSRGIQAQKEASLEKLKSGFDLNNLKETEKELEKIFEETAKKERRKLLIKAAASVMAGAGTAIGMGMLEQMYAGGIKIAPETIKPKAAVSEPVPKLEIPNIVEVHKGDTVWKLAEKQLEERGLFKNLTGTADEITAKKNFLIDSISRKVDVPSGDANLIHAGEKIDFKDIFENKDTVAQLVDKSEHLKPISVGHILENTQKPKIVTDGNKNVLDFFDKQTRPEKWRTIQFYQNDIDSMKENLIKIEDPQIKISVQAEIDRLENIKQSLIHRLAERTEQQVAPKITETIAHILPTEKQNFLDNLIYRDTHFANFKVNALVEQIKTGKLTVEDFSKYYAGKLGAEQVSDEMLNNLKNNFKALIEGSVSEKINASRAMEVILNRLKAIK